MSFLPSLSKIRSSTTGGGSTGRRSAEARKQSGSVAREAVGKKVSQKTYISLQNHMLLHAPAAG